MKNQVRVSEYKKFGGFILKKKCGTGAIFLKRHLSLFNAKFP
jgi:hypothetical protein